MDKINSIQHQLLPILQILDNDNEKQFKKYIFNQEMNSLSNIVHNLDNIMLEIIKLKFAGQSFCEINDRNDIIDKTKLNEEILNNTNLHNQLQNDRENQEVINKFLPLMMYYSMMKNSNNKNNENEELNEEENNDDEIIGPKEKK